jgi:hypothetical protein
LPKWPRTRLTIGIQRRLTKPFHARVKAVLPLRNCFLPASESGLPSNPPNHKSDGGSLQSWNRPSPQPPATGQMNDGSFRFRRKRYQVIATIFAGASPWRGNRLREETAGIVPRRLCVRANKLVRFSRALVQKGSAGYDGFKRNHGKVRSKPRHFGCGRHRHDAQAAAGGRSDVRHPCSSAAAGLAPQVATDDGCRRETK